MSVAALRQKYRALTLAITTVFALLTLVAPALHRHPLAASVSAHASRIAAHTHLEIVPVIVRSDDCVLCTWLEGACYTLARPFAPGSLALSSVMPSWAGARLIALCYASTPSRNPRAPPIGIGG